MIADEGRLAAVTAMKCIVDGATCARGSAGGGGGSATAGGMGPLGVCAEAAGRL